MEDSNRQASYDGPQVPCRPQTTCPAPGISRGWSDVYRADIDCQFIDVTNVNSGETVALVGESGCGKSVTSLAIIGLLPGTGRVDAGSVVPVQRSGTRRRSKCPREAARCGSGMCLEPIAALNPSFTIGSQIIEPLRRNGHLGRAGARRRCLELLDMVEIQRPEQVARSYPHQLSGGMAQRVAIAIAARPAQAADCRRTHDRPRCHCAGRDPAASSGPAGADEWDCCW